MVRLITKCQKETFVYWALKGQDVYGQAIYEAPVELTCRWDDKTQEIQLADRTYVVSRAELITEVRIREGGMIKRGALNTIPYQDDPKRNEDVYEVLKTGEVPTINYRRRLYEAWA
jgi:hypothetical protein